MNNKTITIGIDFDDVYGDMMERLLYRYNNDYNDNLTKASFTEWDMSKVVKPECGSKIYKYFNDPTLYNGMQIIPNATDGVMSLKTLGYRVVFITHTFEGQEGVKYKILKSHGVIDSKKDYFEAEDKSLICVDYLIDDRPLNVQATRGIGILFSQPHNAYFGWDLRFDNWNDIVKFFVEEKNENM